MTKHDDLAYFTKTSRGTNNHVTLITWRIWQHSCYRTWLFNFFVILLFCPKSTNPWRRKCLDRTLPSLNWFFGPCMFERGRHHEISNRSFIFNCEIMRQLSKRYKQLKSSLNPFWRARIKVKGQTDRQSDIENGSWSFTIGGSTWSLPLPHCKILKKYLWYWQMDLEKWLFSSLMSFLS